MKKVGEIIAPMFIRDSNRSPIMCINGSKQRALEDEIKKVLHGELKTVTTALPLHRKLGPNEVIISPSSGRRFGTGGVSDVAPHARRIKITIEVEDETC